MKPAVAGPPTVSLPAVQPVLPYLWMLSGSLAFAVMAALAHGLSQRCDWQVVALVRTAVALVFAALLAGLGGARLVFFRPATLWLRSFMGSISLVCTFFAYSRLPASDVLTLTNMFPLWVALISWPVLGVRPGLGVWASVLSALAGVALIQQPHFAEGNFASLVALASSISTSVAMLGLHRLHGVDPRAVVFHFSAVSLVFCLACLVLFDHGPAGRNLGQWQVQLLLLGVGTAATIGQLFLTKAFAAGPPTRVSVVGLTQVVFAVILDVVIWRHPVGPAKLAGMVLVLAPTAWLMLRPLRRKAEPPTAADNGHADEATADTPADGVGVS